MSELLDNSFLVQSFKVARAMAGVLLCIGVWSSIVYMGGVGFILSGHRSRSFRIGVGWMDATSSSFGCTASIGGVAAL